VQYKHLQNQDSPYSTCFRTHRNPARVAAETAAPRVRMVL